MVFSGETKTRHNFTLPDLKWGVQRSLRCIKLQSHGGDDNRNRRLKTETEREVSPLGVDAEEMKPWNLRKRRRAAACKSPVTESGNCDEDNAKFVSTLSKKEMEDDYMAMMGHRPPRRPKKRIRTLQKQINLLHPGFYFTEVITEDMYEVPDAAETRKALSPRFGCWK